MHRSHFCRHLEDWFFVTAVDWNVFSGKMFQAPDLTLIVEFIFMFYKEKPIDWLLDHILWVKVCNPEKDAVSSFFHVVQGRLFLFFLR